MRGCYLRAIATRGRSIPNFSATDRSACSSEEHQDSAHDHQYDTDGCQDADGSEIPDQCQYDTQNNHVNPHFYCAGTFLTHLLVGSGGVTGLRWSDFVGGGYQRELIAAAPSRVPAMIDPTNKRCWRRKRRCSRGVIGLSSGELCRLRRVPLNFPRAQGFHPSSRDALG